MFYSPREAVTYTHLGSKDSVKYETSMNLFLLIVFYIVFLSTFL